MVGKTLEELSLRHRFQVSVFVVKEKDERGDVRFVTPSAAYVFRHGDTVLLGGKQENIETLEKEL
ncbi:cation:proton antiporter regulatory subunit [Planctomycetota bacterium]